MAAVVPLVAHHQLTQRFLRVDLRGTPSAAGFACAIDTVRRCRGTWRRRNLLLDLRQVASSQANVPAMLGEQLLAELPDVGRIACLQALDTDQRHVQFGPSIRFCSDEAEALSWVASRGPVLADAGSRPNEPKPAASALTGVMRWLLHPIAVAGRRMAARLRPRVAGGAGVQT